jgi:hypothetical protein
MMVDDPKEILIEEAVSGCRERTASGRILPSPAWWDLPTDAREELFQRQLQSRMLERAVAPDGMSATVRSVLSRIKENS